MRHGPNWSENISQFLRLVGVLLFAEGLAGLILGGLWFGHWKVKGFLGIMGSLGFFLMGCVIFARSFRYGKQFTLLERIAIWIAVGLIGVFCIWSGIWLLGR